MFFRRKQSGKKTYLQLVENEWSSGKSKQRVIATVGQLDELIESGGLSSLVQSASKYCDNRNSNYSLIDDGLCFSSHQVGQLLQVSPSTVVGWINQGKLRAFRTPGGHRRVRAGDLRRFLADTRMPLPRELRRKPGTRRVFIVDDDPLVIKAIRRSMRQHTRGGGLEIDGCEDGITALVRIGALRPDLVLLDIYMEGLDGFEVCRRLKRISDLEGLRIVAMSARPSAEDRARILDRGAFDYWPKPVRAEQILEVLEQGAREVTRSA